MKELYFFEITTNKSYPDIYNLILGNRDIGYYVPIIIGKTEAQAIVIAKHHINTSRPISHIAFTRILDGFQIKIESVFIYRFDMGIFYSLLRCKCGDHTQEFDMRTSDAIALAIQKNAPIYMDEDLIKEVGISLSSKSQDKEKDLRTQLKEAIEKEDFETAAKLRDRINELKF